MTDRFSHAVVLGAAGAIGQALTGQLVSQFPAAKVHAFSRSRPKQSLTTCEYHGVDYASEASIAQAAALVADQGPVDLVIVAVGLLHDEELMPEKSLRDLSADKFQRLFEINTIVPALVAKHFLPILDKSSPSVFAALSARVGSVSDNRLGGWYAYRASKAALNMVLKNAAIETGRRNKLATVVGLHPGTVDSGLSKPFQGNAPEHKLFTPEYSAQQLLNVILRLTPEQSGRCFAWDGQEIEP